MNEWIAPDDRLKAPLKLIGAKTGIKKLSPRSKMWALMPEGCHTYIEPFLGSGGVLIGKEPQAREIVNDSQLGVINFYRRVLDSPDELITLTKLMTHKMSEARFLALREDQPDPQRAPLAHAAWYYTINKFARNGIVRFRKRDGMCNSTWGQEEDGRGLLTREWLDRVRERITQVDFYNMDYRIFLGHMRKYADDKTIVVLDPPYSEVFTKYNGGDSFGPADHRDLARLLRYANYRFLLTINDNAYVRKLYGKWANMLETSVYWQCSNTVKGRGDQAELIITNYEVRGSNHDHVRDQAGQSAAGVASAS